MPATAWPFGWTASRLPTPRAPPFPIERTLCKAVLGEPLWRGRSPGGGQKPKAPLPLLAPPAGGLVIDGVQSTTAPKTRPLRWDWLGTEAPTRARGRQRKSCADVDVTTGRHVPRLSESVTSTGTRPLNEHKELVDADSGKRQSRQ